MIDAVVTKIIWSEPKFYYKKYWVKVGFNVMCGSGTTALMFDTIEEAKALKVGYEFLT